MISFVEKKLPDLGFIEGELKASIDENTWTNFGPVSLKLEREASSLLGLPAQRKAVACASGTQALFALVNLHSFVEKKPLRWVVSAFTFSCQRQGALADSIVVDTDAEGFLDIELLKEIDPSSFDGYIVTNTFGKARNVERYEEFAKESGKLLLFDSCTNFYSGYRGELAGRFGDGECFSFHHTKPCGFGEGGLAVIASEHEGAFRSLINFGLYKGIDTAELSMNGKMSDVAAAFILDRIRGVEAIKDGHREQFMRIVRIAKGLSLEVLFDLEDVMEFPTVVPVMFPKVIPDALLLNDHIMLRKYYRPLSENMPMADSIYGRIVLVPCHGDVSALEDGTIKEILSDIQSVDIDDDLQAGKRK